MLVKSPCHRSSPDLSVHAFYARQVSTAHIPLLFTSPAYPLEPGNVDQNEKDQDTPDDTYSLSDEPHYRKCCHVPIMANELSPSLSLDFVPPAVSAALAAARAAVPVKVVLPDTKVVSSIEAAGCSTGGATSVCTSVVCAASENVSHCLTLSNERQHTGSSTRWGTRHRLDTRTAGLSSFLGQGAARRGLRPRRGARGRR